MGDRRRAARRRRADTIDLICLSGRGDKDLAEALDKLGITEPGVTAAAFTRRAGRAALMPYLMGGFPDVETSIAIGEAYTDNGADVIELGVPFSDPLADGPVIHAAATKALEAGANVHQILEIGARLAEQVPVVLMVYANPIFARGPERFAALLAERGISGLIVPDLPLEESEPFLAACDAHGVALVPLVAPTTPDERLSAIGRTARGFVYTVSVTGTTGERAAQHTDMRRRVAPRQGAQPGAGRARLRHLQRCPGGRRRGRRSGRRDRRLAARAGRRRSGRERRRSRCPGGFRGRGASGRTGPVASRAAWGSS